MLDATKDVGKAAATGTEAVDAAAKSLAPSTAGAPPVSSPPIAASTLSSSAPAIKPVQVAPQTASAASAASAASVVSAAAAAAAAAAVGEDAVAALRRKHQIERAKLYGGRGKGVTFFFDLVDSDAKHKHLDT